jgi:hypothetical protein
MGAFHSMGSHTKKDVARGEGKVWVRAFIADSMRKNGQGQVSKLKVV